jgi:hypothetical protein
MKRIDPFSLCGLVLILIAVAMMLTGCAWKDRVDLPAMREEITKYEAELAALRGLAAKHPEVAAVVESAEGTLAAMKTNLAELEKSDRNPPAWVAAGSAVLGFLGGPIGNRLLSMIPVVGPAAGPIANFLFRMAASRAQRKEDDEAYALLEAKKAKL